MSLVREQAKVIGQGIALFILYILRVIISGNKESGGKASSYTTVCGGGFNMVGPGVTWLLHTAAHRSCGYLCGDQAGQNFSLGGEEVMQPTLVEELMAVHDTVELL